MSGVTSPTTTNAGGGGGGAAELDRKRIRSELFSNTSTAANMNRVKTKDDIEAAFTDATTNHPFVDRSHYQGIVQGDSVFCDKNGVMCGVLIRNGLNPKVASMAADVLRPAATRTSLRANIFGGEAPLSGIAGYYDYNGSPIEFKCRKTSFTCEVIDQWKDVFPMVEYCSELYKRVCPESWKAQHAAIPDVVKIRNSPFSTLTINQRFRTAKHTDAGDFDAGYGVITVLEGDYSGLNLGFPDFRVCFNMRPTDVLIFDTHHYHGNTELEILVNSAKLNTWNRLTCVLYYRATLGEANCMRNFKRRLAEAKETGKNTLFEKVDDTDNGENLNRPAPVHKEILSPFLLAAGCLNLFSHSATLKRLHKAVAPSVSSHSSKKAGALCVETTPEQDAFMDALFGESLNLAVNKTGGVKPPRGEHEKLQFDDKAKLIFSSIKTHSGPALGGFSETENFTSMANEKKDFFNDNILSEALTPELYNMWETSREDWLKNVNEDWKKMLARNKDRADFTWNNKGKVNSSFFDLCDVAKEVMLLLLGKEEASPQEANLFWLGYATHLFDKCAAVNKMPPTAMSMKKLNVKLKDYNFGGTRYFKDMSAEEQERRLARKARIQAARKGKKRRGSDDDDSDVTSDDEEHRPTNDWLANDSFDYQTEDCEVDYKKLDVPTALENAVHKFNCACGCGVGGETKLNMLHTSTGKKFAQHQLKRQQKQQSSSSTQPIPADLEEDEALLLSGTSGNTPAAIATPLSAVPPEVAEKNNFKILVVVPSTIPEVVQYLATHSSASNSTDTFAVVLNHFRAIKETVPKLSNLSELTDVQKAQLTYMGATTQKNQAALKALCEVLKDTAGSGQEPQSAGFSADVIASLWDKLKMLYLTAQGASSPTTSTMKKTSFALPFSTTAEVHTASVVELLAKDNLDASFDFVVLRHVLDAASTPYTQMVVNKVRTLTAATLSTASPPMMVVETEKHDRVRYLLQPDIEKAFEEVSVPLWNVLHQATSAAVMPASTVLMPKMDYFASATHLDELLSGGSQNTAVVIDADSDEPVSNDNVLATFAIQHSPLNTSCYLLKL